MIAGRPSARWRSAARTPLGRSEVVALGAGESSTIAFAAELTAEAYDVAAGVIHLRRALRR